MRLLRVSSLTFEEYFEPNIPPYAILSHRWEDEEILYADILSGHFMHKKAFTKFKFTCDQVKRDRLDFVWIDTFCIDKSSSAELSEAINSMFRWYEDSATCYAYLSDYEVGSIYRPEKCTASIWFERGWTLQELLAPREMSFFDTYWGKFGTRASLCDEIAEHTQIPRELLCDRNGRLGPSLREYPVARRMSWAANRKTTRIEDQAYSLLGLFGVNMPLLYGEGNRAFGRLQEEILKIGTDLSMLAWDYTFNSQLVYDQDIWNRRRTKQLFASSPTDFALCDRLDFSVSVRQRSVRDATIALTNLGLQIDRPQIWSSDEGEEFILSLECSDPNQPLSVKGLRLTPASSQRFVAQRDHVVEQHNRLCFVDWDFNLESTRTGRTAEGNIFDCSPSDAWPTLIIAREQLHTIRQIRSEYGNDHHTHVRIKTNEKISLSHWNVVDLFPGHCWKTGDILFTFQQNRVADAKSFDPWGDAGAIALEDDLGNRITITLIRTQNRKPHLYPTSLYFNMEIYDKETFGVNGTYPVSANDQIKPLLDHDREWHEHYQTLMLPDKQEIELSLVEVSRPAGRLAQLLLTSRATDFDKSESLRISEKSLRASDFLEVGTSRLRKYVRKSFDRG